MSSLLQIIINASEKAANIARSCVGIGDNALLVAEKAEGEANTRFDKDFKTIADVMAQESIKSDIVKHYPEMASHIRGEECPQIDGKTITLMETEAETFELLRNVVTPNLAMRLAEAAHKTTHHVFSECIPQDLPDLDTSDLGVWIDPIDATAEFISGVNGQAKPGGGLKCVTVLIGVYSRSTGVPIVGVINQPFFKCDRSRIFWGYCNNNVKKWGDSLDSNESPKTKTILISSAEEDEIKQQLLEANYQISSLPGAGFKLMNVIGSGEAEAYVLSKGTSFLWDTCAPHAILKAKGGDIICYSTQNPIKYNIIECENIQQYCNSSGIIAYSNYDVYQSICTALSLKNI